MNRMKVIDPSAPSVAKTRTVLYLILLAIVVFFVWSYHAPLNSVVRGTGRVEPREATQSIQNLEGGIVKAIHVGEGDMVAAGQLLAEMDDTAYRSAYDELLGREALLEMQILRLQAEANLDRNEILEIPPALAERAPEAAATEAALYAARRQQFIETMDVLQKIKSSREAELAIRKPLAERGAIPEADLISAEQLVLEMERQITEYRTGFDASRTELLSQLQSELAQIRQQLRVRAAQVERSVLRAPMAGVVNRVVVRTAGGVVAPGDPIMEIIPLDDKPIVAGRILPGDIGPVYLGMSANVKLTAFDYRDYGSLVGSVIHISADTVTDEEMRDPQPFFEIIVELEGQSLIGPAGEVFIRPGMQASVELDAGQNTVFNYLFHPLLRAGEAFTEPD